MSELKAFIGLLYIAGFYRSGRQNTADLWASDAYALRACNATCTQTVRHMLVHQFWAQFSGAQEVSLIDAIHDPV
ncbi:unnamed protein product [Parnassius mnemosyne]|uniref:PiggyBac transposable element-derived protein domain-containing protein n=1 Tax=Parnassius mnemosyne TaxID=213953 RepID=A0AAV1L130_9NEOP